MTELTILSWPDLTIGKYTCLLAHLCTGIFHELQNAVILSEFLYTKKFKTINLYGIIRIDYVKKKPADQHLSRNQLFTNLSITASPKSEVSKLFFAPVPFGSPAQKNGPFFKKWAYHASELNELPQFVLIRLILIAW